jgi:hypothetical protein
MTIADAKLALPLPALMHREGLAAHAKKSARCPLHDDKRASFSIYKNGRGEWRFKCFSKCGSGDEIDFLAKRRGISKREAAKLFIEMAGGRNGEVKSRRRIAATYDYRDENGKIVHQTVRYDKPKKDFKQRRPDGKGGWIWNLDGVGRVLFRLPEITQDIRDGLPIYVCAGEKDALAMVEHGFSSTTNPCGEGNWMDTYSKTLRGADVIIVADKDEKGREHAQTVASKLRGVARFVRVIELPDVNGTAVKDPADFFAANGTAEQLQKLADTAPEWTPNPETVRQVEQQQDDIRGEIISIFTDDELSAAEKRTRIAEAIVQALIKRGRFFFHAERRDFDSAMFFDNSRKRLERVRSDSFLAWLSSWLRINRADAVFKYITAEIETAALSSPQTTGIIPESFWVSRPGAIYLSSNDAEMVKVTASGVETVANGTEDVLFAAGNTLAPWTLVNPQNPFSACSIFSDANCAAEHGLSLLCLWILSLPTNPASKPPLCLAGDVGSGKTRLAKGIAEFYGLPFVANKVEEYGEESFWVSLDGGGLFTLDNADTRNKWLSDAVAAAATDGCSQRRKLYTNADTVTLRARAWLCLTTANPTFAADAGLADRLLPIRMNRRTNETSDAKLSDEIRENRDAGLSFVAHTLSKALADNRPTPASLNHRHPDFAELAVKIGRAIGREIEAIATLKTVEQDKAMFCLENDFIGAALLDYLAQTKSFTGTSAELRERLVEHDDDLNEKRLSVKRLGKRLSTLWPHLEKVLKARKEKDRNHFTIFSFTAPNAECAEFQTVFSTKPPYTRSRGDF